MPLCSNTVDLLIKTKIKFKMNNLTEQNKKSISSLLAEYVGTFDSQKAAATSLNDCSEATLIQMLNGNWKNIADAMWFNVGKQVGFTGKEKPLVETLTFLTLCLYFDIAKDNGSTIAVIGNAGCGKSYTGKFYAKAHRKNNVYYLECAEYWSKKDFLKLLLQKIGRNETGLNVAEMMQLIVKELRRKNAPLIILDEVDKLSDAVLKFFITLYNELNGMCGFVWTSTNNIQKRVTKGINSNKNGYQELKSRVGQNFIELPIASPDEVRELCKVHGITSDVQVATVVNEFTGDLRRVERHVLKNTMKTTLSTLKKAS